MLEAVGHPHAVNPDKELRRVAAANGWPVLVFTRPVGLRSRVPFASRPTSPPSPSVAPSRWAGWSGPAYDGAARR